MKCDTVTAEITRKISIFPVFIGVYTHNTLISTKKEKFSKDDNN